MGSQTLALTYKWVFFIVDEPQYLMGYSPWGYKESDMTEQLTLICNHIYSSKFLKFLSNINETEWKAVYS